MKINVKLEQDRGMRESQVRDAIDRAAARARETDAQRGRKEQSHEAIRSEVAKLAERDRQRGKI